MKDTGLDEWFIDVTLKQAGYYRKGYASRLSDAVESIIGSKPISFAIRFVYQKTVHPKSQLTKGIS